MYVKKGHSILVIVFLAAFLSAQLAVYHTFSHDGDSIENCKVCDEAVSFNHTPVLLADEAAIEEPVLIPEYVTDMNVIHNDPVQDSDYQAFLYCRPPPSLI